VTIPFSPPADKHYWLAMAYEAQKKLPEAAIEWRAYLDSADPLYERRAEDHLKGINAELAKKKDKKPDKKTTTGTTTTGGTTTPRPPMPRAIP
jgi:hypothetical protein